MKEFIDLVGQMIDACSEENGVSVHDIEEQITLLAEKNEINKKHYTFEVEHVFDSPGTDIYIAVFSYWYEEEVMTNCYTFYQH